jgi:hypothetical protein
LTPWIGPRLFMAAGPLIAAAGILLLIRVGMHVSYLGGVLPALVVFALGLSMTVAPLTATVLADADETDAGIASAINTAVARVAGLAGVAVIGAAVASTLTGDTFAPNQASVHAFHQALLICAALVATGGVTGAVGIVNPARLQAAAPVGQLVGAPEPALHTSTWAERATTRRASALYTVRSLLIMRFDLPGRYVLEAPSSGPGRPAICPQDLSICPFAGQRSSTAPRKRVGLAQSTGLARSMPSGL